MSLGVLTDLEKDKPSETLSSELWGYNLLIKFTLRLYSGDSGKTLFKINSFRILVSKD